MADSLGVSPKSNTWPFTVYCFEMKTIFLVGKALVWEISVVKLMANACCVLVASSLW